MTDTGVLAFPAGDPCAIAYLFIAAFLARDAVQARLLIEQLTDTGLHELEEVLRGNAIATYDDFAERGQEFTRYLDKNDMWDVLAVMAGPGSRDVVQANRDRVEAGRPPRVHSRTDWIAIIAAEAAVITTLYESVSPDTGPVQEALRLSARRHIEGR